MKHDMLRRFSFIEARLLWAGGLTANELAEAFGIARQNAQQSITAYARQHPGQLKYDRSQRRQVPTDAFEVRYVRDDVGRFLDYQRAVAHVARFYDEPDWADLPFTDVDGLTHPLYDRDAARTALSALRRQMIVVIGYWAMRGARTRRISPHHLVYADGRYHLRAYCLETDQFRDFAIARIVTAELSQEPWISESADKDWQERIDLEFEINPHLDDEAKAALKKDYMTAGASTLVIRGARKAVAFYIKRRFTRIDHRYHMPLWRTLNS